MELLGHELAQVLRNLIQLLGLMLWRKCYLRLGSFNWPIRIFYIVVFELWIQTSFSVLSNHLPAIILILGARTVVSHRRVDDLVVHVLVSHLVRSYHSAVVVPLSLTIGYEINSLVHHLVVLLSDPPGIWSRQHVVVSVLVESECRG